MDFRTSCCGTLPDHCRCPLQYAQTYSGKIYREKLESTEVQKREERQRLITRYNVKEAMQSLPKGHPAAKKLAEALALLEN